MHYININLNQIPWMRKNVQYVVYVCSEDDSYLTYWHGVLDLAWIATALLELSLILQE